MKRAFIALAESANGRDWKFWRTVIREPFVTSHPSVFKWRKDHYFIPEAHIETSVRLYRATEFPDKWAYEGDLLKGDRFISTTAYAEKMIDIHIVRTFGTGWNSDAMHHVDALGE